MATKKYYSVKIGKNPGIYETWSECENQVKGFPGAKYKAFPTLIDAEKYLTCQEESTESGAEAVDVDNINKMIENEISNLNEDEIVAFVDGTYKDGKSGFGVIILDKDKNETASYKSFTEGLSPEFLELRNVAAELEGVKDAVKGAISRKMKKITIFYDYEGIGNWADGSWKANNDITRQYVKFIQDSRAYIKISFIKVPAHSGVYYNEVADKLAKNSLLEKGYKTYNDGSIYIVGYSKDDWESIVDIANQEQNSFEDENADNSKKIITFSAQDRGNGRERIEISDSRYKVVVNCYSGRSSYMQGKQSPLFEKILSFAIEMMKTDQIVVEVLNKYHVLTLSQADVEERFEKLLPNYSGDRNGKHYNNLLTAVYNTMLLGYIPDYTALLSPVFRSYEYYLHRILGEKMGLDTSDENGRNNFSYFSKDANGRYLCNHKNISLLHDKQKDFLNNLYNEYNGIRHPYSHWSVDDYDTAVITDINVAKDYINKGLTLFDKYYRLF